MKLQFYEVIFYSEVCKLYFSCPPDITIIVVSSVRETNKITELKVKPQQIRLLAPWQKSCRRGKININHGRLVTKSTQLLCHHLPFNADHITYYYYDQVFKKRVDKKYKQRTF